MKPIHHLLPFACACGILLSLPQAHAATYTWTDTTTGTRDWTTAGNWLSSLEYVSDPANELVFFSDSTTNFPTLGGAMSITTNVPATLAMNTLTLNGKGNSSGASAVTVTIGTSASTWTIGDGTTSIVNLNANYGASAAADFRVTVASNLTLNQANTVFTGNGTGGLNNTAAATSTGNGFLFSGSIGQSASGYGITKEGTSRLTLSSSNLTFTGPLTVNGGYLILTGNSNLASGSMTVNSGAFLRIGNNTATQIGTAGVYSGNISTGTGGTLQLWSSSAQEFSGIISGSGGINKAYGGTLTLSGANTYTGKSQFLPQTTTGFTVNVSSFDYITSGSWANHGLGSSLGAPTTVANGTIDVGDTGKQAGVNLTYVSTATGETTDRVINLGFNGTSNQTITANNSTGVLRFTSAFTSNTGTSGKLILTGTGAGQIDQGLPQIANGGLDKQGTGTWTLGGSGNFTGQTLITAGTLSLSSATALQYSPFNTASVAGGASAGLKIATTTLSLGGLTGSNALDTRFTTALGGPSSATAQGGYAGLTALTLTNAAGTTSTYSGNIVDGATGMTLTKTGVGTQILTGINSYTGLTTVSGGTLVSNSTFTGAVAVTSGGALSPGATAGSIGTLTINDASASAFTMNRGRLLVDLPNSGASDLVAITGGLVLSSTNTIDLALPGAGVSAGTYTLMTYSAQTGAGSLVFTNGQTTLGNATLTVGATSTTLTAGAGGLNHSVWVGTGTSAAWDTSSSFWTRNGTATQQYVAGDFVTIDDTATATTITGAAAPAMVTVNNTSKTFTISATISDFGGGVKTSLIKSGTGTLYLTGTQSFTGGIILNGGTLGDNTTNLTAAALNGNAITVNSNASLGLAAGASLTSAVTLNGGAILTIANNNGSTSWSGAFTGTGGITLGKLGSGANTINLNSSANNFTGAVDYLNDAAVTVALVVNSFVDSTSLGTGKIRFASTGNAAATHVFTLNTGFTAGGNGLTFANRQFEIAGGNATAIQINNNSTEAFAINTDLINSSTVAKTLTLGGTGAGVSTYGGNIGNSNNGSLLGIAKAGTGTWTLSGTSNTFTGNITLNSTNTSAGTFAYASAGGTNNIVFNQTTGTATLSYTGSTAKTMSGTITASALTTGTITFDASGTNSAATVSYTNASGIGTSTSTGARKIVFTGSNTGDNIFAPIIANNTGAGGTATVTKNGIGTWVLSGTSTYTGATTVDAGNLLVNGALGNSAVTVNGGAFGGSGSIGSSLTLNTGTMFYVVDLMDALQVAGTVTIYAGFGVDDLTGLTWGSVADGTYTLINGTLGSGVFDALANNSAGTAYDLGGGRSAYFQEGSLQLVVATIPEPGVAMLGGLSLFGLLLRRRRS